mgnify:CR=1 FL=1
MSELLEKIRQHVMAHVAPEDFPDGGVGYECSFDAALRLAEREGAVGECGCEKCWKRLAEASEAVEALLR